MQNSTEPTFPTDEEYAWAKRIVAIVNGRKGAEALKSRLSLDRNARQEHYSKIAAARRANAVPPGH